jgi:hypothetical protein
MCGSGGSICNKDTGQNTLPITIFALTMIYPATGWFEIVKATNKSATSIQNLFHNTWLARYGYLQPQCIVFDHLQTNAIIERVHKVVNDMLRSFDLENTRDNLEEQENNPFDYFHQSTAGLQYY